MRRLADQLDQLQGSYYLVSLVKEASMPTVNLYEAKTRLSALVERAAAGEEIVIAKNGVARARLVPVVAMSAPRRPADALRISHIAEDFDAPDSTIARLFAGGGG
jgi:prevent-host-death family protein